MKPKVSIIMPTFNSQEFLSEAIESVFNQTYKEWELIIIDDNSKDCTPMIIEKFSMQDVRIKFRILNINGGAAKARNIGLKMAKGNFIAFLDSDDLWLPQKLSVQLAFMERYKYPISFSSYEVFSDKSNFKYTIKSVEKLNYHNYLKNTLIGCSTAVINRDIVGNFSFREDMRTRQDTKLWLTLLKRGHEAHGIEEVLVKYRTHEHSISNNKIKAAIMVWKLYFNIERLSFAKSIYFFLHYALNAVLKRF